jgi:hypothetical protein
MRFRFLLKMKKCNSNVTGCAVFDNKLDYYYYYYLICNGGALAIYINVVQPKAL